MRLRPSIFFLWIGLLLSFCSCVPKYNVEKQLVEHEEEVSLDGLSNKNILPLDLRSLKDWQLLNVLLVSDIDGNLHGVERNTGASLWTLPLDEPLVQVSNNGAQSGLLPDSNMLWLVEPYQDGSLYYFSPQFGLNKLPTSIKNLVMESPFSLKGDNKIYTGIRKTSLYTINLKTGQVINSFGSVEESCPAPNLYRPPSFSDDLTKETIMLGKTTYELLIHNKNDPNIIWNITYSAWGPNNIDNDLIMQNVQSVDNLYFTPFYDKSLLALNRNAAAPQWVNRLPSLAVNVFDIFKDLKRNDQYVMLPHPLKVLNELQNTLTNEAALGSKNDICFINKTASGKEWFAMSMKNYPTLLKSAPISHYQMGLYQLSAGTLDPTLKSYFHHLNVAKPEVEPIINGAHQIYHLVPLEMYQPQPKFTDGEPVLQIGDGETRDKSPSTHTRPPKIPDMIDGILFPHTQDHPGNNIATIIEKGKELIGSDKKHSHSLPIPLYGASDGPADSRRSLLMVRRIAEDLIVSAVLLVFFVAFGKLNGYISKNKITKKSTTLEAADDAQNQSLSDHENSSLGSNAFNEEILDESENVETTKRVSILTPEDEMNKLSAEEKEHPEGPPDIQTDGDPDSPEGEMVTKKKRKRGGRGGKRGGKGKKANTSVELEAKGNLSAEDGSYENNDDESESSKYEEALTNEIETNRAIPTKSLVKSFKRPQSQPKKLQIDNNLIISDKILGYGSHGTVVFEGTFENRPVAVKRMLLDFYDVANHEVRLLQESDDHPNVIRYFCSQSSESEKFLYIALERCDCSLEDLIEKQKANISLTTNGVKNEILHQLVSGLHYLHSLKIVHRDLKPQNILVGVNSKKDKSTVAFRLLISDFGLCKKLDADQSSFRATAQHAASGTSGWRAPELLLHHDLLEISPDMVSSVHSTSKKDDPNNTSSGKRLTKAIDIFSLGCVFYYILTNGGHPFGDRYLREGNIIKGEYDLSGLKNHCPNDSVEASDLLSSMIAFNPKTRPDTTLLLKHPYFWSMNKKLEFLLKVSDRFEVENRDPPSALLLTLESTGKRVHQGDWLSKFDNDFIENLGKYRKYSTNKVMDLLRALRNKYHHFNDMPSDLQTQMSPLPHGFYTYFNAKFPRLLMEIYYVVKNNIREEHVFDEFF